MSQLSFSPKSLRSLVALGSLAVAFVSSGLAFAADPSIVGVLSLAIEKDVADKIGLSDEQRTALQDLVTQRETDVLDLNDEIKELPAAEKAAKLAAFAAESEKLGLAQLSDEQKTKLNQVKLAKTGMQSLADPAVVKALTITAEQQEKVAGLIKERDEQIVAGGESKRSITQSYYERKLAGVLTPEQKAKWDELAGLKSGEAAGSAEAAPGGEKPATPPMTTERPTTPSRGPERGSERPGTPPTVAKVDPASRPILKASPDGKIRFNFRHAPYQTVLEWFAAQAEMSLEFTSMVPGTFNLTDGKAYTPAEAIDILNGHMLLRGYTLLRREKMLVLINLEDGIPPHLVSKVSPLDLDKRGEFEIVDCVFQLDKYPIEEAEADIKRVIGKQGTVRSIPKARQLLVIETAGNLRVIRGIIDAVENPDATREEQIVEVPLKVADVDIILPKVRSLLGITDERNQLPDSSLRFVPDPTNKLFLVSGKGEKIKRFQEIVKLLDKESNAPLVPEGDPTESPQLEFHKVNGIDSALALKVVSSLLAGDPVVRLEIDPKTQNIVAYAKPSQHLMIKALMEQLQGSKKTTEVIKLRVLDTSLVILTLNKIFNAGEGGDPNAPKIDGDPTLRQLIIYGSPDQIEEIKSLVEKMGEASADSMLAEAEQSNVRMIALPGVSAQRVIDSVNTNWPVLGRANRIRVVTPSSESGGGGLIQEKTPPPRTPMRDPLDEELDSLIPRLPTTPLTPKPTPKIEGEPPVRGTTTPAAPKAKEPIPAESKPAEKKPETSAARATTARLPQRVPVRYTSYVQPGAESEDPSPAPSAKPANPTEKPTDMAETKPEKKPSKPGAEIIVTLVPGGVVIASEDIEALNAYEELFRSLADRMATPAGSDFTVYNLEHAKAEVAASLLSEIIGASSGADSGSSGGGGGGLFGAIAGAAFGGGGGGGNLIGDLLGLGGGGGGTAAPAIATTGKVTVIPDVRLNRLFVQAGPADIELVDELIQMIDREFSPADVQTTPTPKVIPVKHVPVEEMETKIRNIFAQQIAAAQGQQRQQQPPNPEDFIRALRGGGGGRGGRGGQQSRGEETKMTLASDPRSKVLIVSAPPPLFAKVEAMVAELDIPTSEDDEYTQVVHLKSVNPELVQRAITAQFGTKATINTNRAGMATPQASSAVAGAAPGSAPGGGFNRGGDSRGGDSGARQFGEIFSGIQQLQQLQQGGGFGGRGGGSSGGGRGGSSGSGRSSRGGR